MLVLEGVSKTYDGKRMAVNRLNLAVNAGEIFGFIGPNGAGKTTTIKMLTGLLPPTEGRIMINGVDLAASPVEAKRNFTYVPDHPEIFTAIRGIDYLNFIADMHEVPTAKRRTRIEKYTRMFAIDDALGEMIHSYSHGMKQKLLICGALLPQAPLFILDEPLVGLDPLAAKHLKEIMVHHCAAGEEEWTKKTE